MKKILFFLFAAGLFFTNSINGQSVNWIKTNGEQIECKKIRPQENSVKIVTSNNEKQIIPQSQIESYFTDGKHFVKKVLVSKNENREVFMEFIKTRDNLSLFKYTLVTNDKSWDVKYLVYKGDEFYLEVIDANRSEFEKFFFTQLF